MALRPADELPGSLRAPDLQKLAVTLPTGTESYLTALDKLVGLLHTVLNGREQEGRPIRQFVTTKCLVERPLWPVLFGVGRPLWLETELCLCDIHAAD